jgi:ATP-dependent Lon protease
MQSAAGLRQNKKNEEVELIAKKLEAFNLPEETKKLIEQEIKKVSRLSP